MIHLSGLEKRYASQELFRDVSWHIKPGQRIGLIGPNGAGKSTLLKIIVGDETPDGGSVTIGKGTTLGYLRQDIALLAGVSVRDEVRKGLAHVIAVGHELRSVEEQMASLDGDALERIMERYGELQAQFEEMGGFQIENRVEEVLSGLGFKQADFDRDCGELSGGWQMRVVLSKLLLQGPDILLLDEPTNHLDLESLQWLENFLQTYRGSLVFVSHDRWFLNRLSSHIAELSRYGLRTYRGNFDAYLKQVTEAQELLERRQKNQERRRAELERFISRFRAKATKARQVQSRVKALEKMETIELARTERTIRFSLPEPPKCGQVLMELTDVDKAYGDNVIYGGLNVQLLRGRRIALVGPNGAGKTTLLKLLAGSLRADRGERALGFGAKPYYFAQHQVEALDLKQTVMREAQDALENQTLSQIRGILGAFLFGDDDIDKKVEVLSGGEKARLALVKMLLTPNNLLLLDEPTNHLDMASRAVLEEALSNFPGTVVLISHDRHFIDAVCNEVWEVEAGRVTPFLCNYTDYRSRATANDRPEPFPLGRTAETARKKSKTEPADPIIEPKSETPKTIDWSGGGDIRRRKSRSEKREAAQYRQSRSLARRSLKVAYDRAEQAVTLLEGKLEVLQAEQADPAHYQNAERVQVVAREVSELSSQLTDAYTDWEQRGEVLETFDAETEQGLNG